ncbi:hypothetical protein HJ588_14365 [Flexivirga sp. ID2601S]|uniref:Uncharacterized protein n=1 Tax=Flexivirga aerilata TaxID=1656889 RepID=A0A849AJA1_9MICO|nr:hypothetical protein [Flexivirga aerilata]NNG40449.1 hypothetical protein [Flexivirga aerilata]
MTVDVRLDAVHVAGRRGRRNDAVLAAIRNLVAAGATTLPIAARSIRLRRWRLLWVRQHRPDVAELPELADDATGLTDQIRRRLLGRAQWLEANPGA